MRPLIVLGILLIAAGGFVLFHGASYRTDRSVLQVGEFRASVEEERAIPPWVGGAAAAVGLGLVLAGVRRRS